MNWIDWTLIALLLAMVVVGSKKGLVRETSAFIIFFAAIICSVNYVDGFAAWMADKTGGSPLISALLSFITLLAGSYATFKLLGLLFYRVANIKQIGRKDQVGGALVGFLRGWMAIGFLTFLTFLMPMPEAYYTAFGASFFGPTMAKTIPRMSEGTARVHPKNPDFMQKIEKTLLAEPAGGRPGGTLKEDKVEVYRALYQIEKYFKTGLNTP
jgi:uncharacterized membrane protein required for colicin V production